MFVTFSIFGMGTKKEGCLPLSFVVCLLAKVQSVFPMPRQWFAGCPIQRNTSRSQSLKCGVVLNHNVLRVGFGLTLVPCGVPQYVSRCGVGFLLALSYQNSSISKPHSPTANASCARRFSSSFFPMYSNSTTSLSSATSFFAASYVIMVGQSKPPSR